MQRACERNKCVRPNAKQKTMTNLKQLQHHLNYSFKNEELLTLALTHRSKQKVRNNERIEFLGDSVLSLTISTEIFRRHPKLREGELSRLRAALVKGETIAKISAELGLTIVCNWVQVN